MTTEQWRAQTVKGAAAELPWTVSVASRAQNLAQTSVACYIPSFPYFLFLFTVIGPINPLTPKSLWAFIYFIYLLVGLFNYKTALLTYLFIYLAILWQFNLKYMIT